MAPVRIISVFNANNAPVVSFNHEEKDVNLTERYLTNQEMVCVFLAAFEPVLILDVSVMWKNWKA